MGARSKNVEAVTDFADNRHFIRLHRDIIVPATVCEAVRRHLAGPIPPHRTVCNRGEKRSA